MRANKRTEARPERALRSFLNRSGLRFRKDYPLTVDETRVRPNIVFTRVRVAVLMDGFLWHSCNANGRFPSANQQY